MKKLLCLLFLSFSLFSFCQKEEKIELIDSNWAQEIIKIPFWFAPEINYNGVEDIRFAKGWEDIKSDGFWALVFA
jgi:hypothetical protein